MSTEATGTARAAGITKRPVGSGAAPGGGAGGMWGENRDRTRRIVRAVAPPVVVALVALWVIPAYFNSYWLYEMTAGVISIVIMQSLGIITGRVGIMSLCQLSFAMIGAWVAGMCTVGNVPGGFYLWMILGGLAAVPFGLVIGLPALRLRGVNLAIVTFAFATALDIIFATFQYPGSQSFEKVARPAGFTSDGGYFRFVVIVVVILFVVLFLLDRTRLGASWLEVRYSERGSAAHGTNVAMSKLTAFAISAFFAGLCGALMAGQAGSLTSSTFTAQGSLVLFALAVVIGTRFWEAAAIAGLFGALIPPILDLWNIDQNYVSIVFGIFAVIILAGGKGQLGQSEIMRARKEARTARRLLAERATRPRPPAAPVAGSTAPPAVPTHAATALDMCDIRVTFGAVTAVDGVTVAIPSGIVVALIGPNGAGKSTLINAATGFTRYTGSVKLGGESLDGLPPHRRAKAGLRRSFQQLRVPPTLSVGTFLNVAAGRRLAPAETAEFLDWFDLPPAHVSIGTMDVGSRRLLEVAGLAAGRPTVLLLDEPAAGQGARETTILSQRIAEIPQRTGSTVLLVEHDIDVIRSACSWVIVMDFGKVIASGPPDEVLANPAVIKAYIGAEHDEHAEPAEAGEPAEPSSSSDHDPHSPVPPDPAAGTPGALPQER